MNKIIDRCCVEYTTQREHNEIRQNTNLKLIGHIIMYNIDLY